MIGNGHSGNHQDDAYYGGASTQHQVMGANSALLAVTTLDRAADALREVGRALHGLTRGVREIHSDTARAISDTVELKKHLKAITAREQDVRRELDEIKAQMVRKRAPRKAKSAASARKVRRRK